MRIGWRMLDVLQAADSDEGARTHVDPHGRITVEGIDEWHRVDVLDRLLDSGLVALGVAVPDGHGVELTERGAQELNEYRRRHRS